MKKIYLLLGACIALTFGCEQKTTESTTTVQTEEATQSDTTNKSASMAQAEPEIYLGGQPVDTTKCYKPEDFKQKITINQQPAVDSSDVEFIQVKGMRPTKLTRVKIGEELQNFDLHNWLTGNGKKTESSKGLGSERMYIEYTYYKNGESKSVGKNFNFCKE